MTDTPAKSVIVKFVVDGQEVGMIMLAPKNFSTGSVGYFGTGKVSLGDDAEKGYQIQIQAVKIGSKPTK